VSDKYELIDAEYADTTPATGGPAPTIIQMCGWLGVSRSGFMSGGSA
jgi:putative transposase